MGSFQPYPPERVRDASYPETLAGHVESSGFPNPDADLIPELTTARFVAAAAREAGEDEFADRIEAIRNSVFEPFNRFEVVGALAEDHRPDDSESAEFDALLDEVGLSGVDVPDNSDTESFFTEHLLERELTFFDYPAPPLHVIEAADSRGQTEEDDLAREQYENLPDEYRTYGMQRLRIEGIVHGARGIAADIYDEAIDDIRDRSLSDRKYEDADEYAEVVAFNTALTAEAMLEDNGELVTPP